MPRARFAPPASELNDLAEAVHKAIQTPSDCLGQNIASDASIGIAIAPDDGASLEELLKNADLAMYAAKANGHHTHRFFAPEMDAGLKS